MAMDLRTTDNARIWLDDEGILHEVAIGVESTAHSVDRNFAIFRELTGGKRVPILFDSRDWPKGDPASWSHFIAIIESVCTAAAVVANANSVAAMGAFPKVVDELLIPFRVFDAEEPALAFLRSHLVS
jgi:hypothetical protein